MCVSVQAPFLGQHKLRHSLFFVLRWHW